VIALMSRRDDLRLVPTELAALAAGVGTATIRQWAKRGKLTRYGKPSRAEYDLGEIFGILSQQRTDPPVS
jgi:hypothetical protein